MDPLTYADSVPHEYFKYLRETQPIALRSDDAPSIPYWAVTSHEACVHVNREWEEFSSFPKTSLINDIPEDLIFQQQLMMLNMDPPDHTRYRRLVNKAFTPRMVRDLEARLHTVTDSLLDKVSERGEADFVVDIAAELPLIVIAELMGVPFEDRHKMFDWSNTISEATILSTRSRKRRAAWRRWSSTAMRPSSSRPSERTPARTS